MQDFNSGGGLLGVGAGFGEGEEVDGSQGNMWTSLFQSILM